jgi:putative spermidine/putrescine transport system permease protein
VKAGRRWRPGPAALALATAGVLAFLALPIVVIALLSFTAGEYLAFPPPGLSLRWHAAVLRSPEWRAALGVSFRVALLATAASTTLSVMAALALVRGRFRWKRAAYALLLAPLIVPTIISAIALHFFFSGLGLIGTVAAIAAGHTVLALPVATILVTGTLQGFDVRLEQAALSMGASRWTAFRRVTLPLIAPGVASAALFSFLTSFEELLVPLFVAGPFTETLPLRVWNSVLFGLDPTITAVSTLLIGITVVVLGAAAALRGGRPGSP